MSSGTKFSLVMAVYDDFYGVLPTVEAARMYHAGRIAEVVVLDNNPDSAHGKDTANFCNDANAKDGIPVRYVRFTDVNGTAVTRNRAIAAALSDHVVCCDPHVLFPLNAFDALAAFLGDWEKKTGRPFDGLAHGPLLYNNLVSQSSHFNDEWSDHMLGKWDDDPRRLNEQWFDSPAQGLGVFYTRKETWLGFNEANRGFGGEEHYIHRKYRNAGRRTICVSRFTWWHRFGRPGGVPYTLSNRDKLINYIQNWTELGDLAELGRTREHFKVSAEKWQEYVAIANGDLPRTPPLPPLRPAPQPQAAAGCPTGTCGGGEAVRKMTIDEWYTISAQTKSDINEHVPTLKTLAAGCDLVVEFGVRTGVSTAGLVAGRPKRLYSFDLNDSPQARAMTEEARKEGVDYSFFIGDSLTVEIPDGVDLLFIDTKHTGAHVLKELERHAPKVRKRIAFHDTEIFGENGEDGSPGLMQGIRAFLIKYPEWTAVRHDRNNHGFTVISRDPADKQTLPGVIRQGINFAAATWRHKTNGGKYLPLELAAARMETCLTCPIRSGDRCAKCSCYLLRVGEDAPINKGQPGKIFYPTEECPFSHWLADKDAGVEMTPEQAEANVRAVYDRFATAGDPASAAAACDGKGGCGKPECGDAGCGRS